jgi:hypothetical protein
VGIWSYGLAIRRKREHRPLYVFQGGTLYGGESMVAYTPPTKCPTGGGREWNAFQVMGGFSKKWSSPLPKVEALAATEQALYLAGASGEVTMLATADGKKQGSLKVPSSPVWDGMAVAYGRIYLSLENGSVACLGTPGGSVPSPEMLASTPRARAEGTLPANAPTSEAAQSPAVPDEKKLNPWIEQLRERIRAAVGRGDQTTAYLALAGEKSGKVKVISADEKSLTIDLKGGRLPVPWKQFDLSAYTALAQAFAGEKDAEGRLLLGVFLMASGRTDDGDRELSQAVLLDPKLDGRVKEARALMK